MVGGRGVGVGGRNGVCDRVMGAGVPYFGLSAISQESRRLKRGTAETAAAFFSTEPDRQMGRGVGREMQIPKEENGPTEGEGSLVDGFQHSVNRKRLPQAELTQTYQPMYRQS